MKMFWKGFLDGIKSWGFAVLIVAGLIGAVFLICLLSAWLVAAFGPYLGIIVFAGALVIIFSIYSGISHYRTYQRALEDERRADKWYNICKDCWDDAMEKYGVNSEQEVKAHTELELALRQQEVAQEWLYKVINGTYKR